jgi:hypothetical protein
MFSSSPNDPRYHMLSHLSAKFKQDAKDQSQEPRAALFLNRFTRTLTVMYATTGIEQIIGMSSENMKGKSFYYCIAENCLEDAVKCLETAKRNDSIAYLRFWFRDPRREESNQDTTSEDETETDADMTDVGISEDDEEGGVQLASGQSASVSASASTSTSGGGATSPGQSQGLSSPSSGSNAMEVDPRGPAGEASRTPSGDSINPSNTHAAMFGDSVPSQSSVSSASTSPLTSNRPEGNPIELEAVVSCTSDGLVVCLRRARPVLPQSMQETRAQPQPYNNGVFAAPWGPQPIYFPPQQQTAPMAGYFAGMELTPHAPMAGQLYGGPAQAALMNSIREVACFAWALTGINGSLEEYSRGRPSGESQPPEGFPIWDPAHRGDSSSSSTSATAVSHASSGKYGFGDPGL